MKLLFDTQAFLWWDSEPGKLSPEVIDALNDRANTLVLSVVSVWEMQIKHQIGKLALKRPLKELVEEQQKANQIQLLPALVSHVLSLQALPMHHKDPFDRLLIAQAITEDLTLVSYDLVFQQYSVKLFF